MSEYLLGIDQSTQGTKALLFDGNGELLCRADLPHKQMIDERGFVEHDPMEIYRNTVEVIREVVKKGNISPGDIRGIGISNQRETVMIWDKETGKPVYNAIVWQCARGESICKGLEENGWEPEIRKRTGLRLSPYFSAAKIAWVIQNIEGVKEKNATGKLCIGTMDSWLIYKLTEKREFRTDYSNASRTQLFNVSTLEWDKKVCELFGINIACLPTVCDSDSLFGMTNVEGFLENAIPIHSAMGDSHGALFGQGCLTEGMIKATYGTGSSIMMNIGEKPVFSQDGVVTSLAWKIGGKVNYVLEGNINYTGAVITWLQTDMKLISNAMETETLAIEANPSDQTYLIPAFSGLGAPYWDSKAKASIVGMTRTTGQAEVVKAGLECIAYQITDVVTLMGEASGVKIEGLRVDGGPTRNGYLMQFQSDMLGIPVQVPKAEELSGIGAAYAAGLAMGIYEKNNLFLRMERKCFVPKMEKNIREQKYMGWKSAVDTVLTKCAK